MINRWSIRRRDDRSARHRLATCTGAGRKIPPPASVRALHRLVAGQDLIRVGRPGDREQRQNRNDGQCFHGQHCRFRLWRKRSELGAFSGRTRETSWLPRQASDQPEKRLRYSEGDMPRCRMNARRIRSSSPKPARRATSTTPRISPLSSNNRAVSTRSASTPLAGVIPVRLV